MLGATRSNWITLPVPFGAVIFGPTRAHTVHPVAPESGPGGDSRFAGPRHVSRETSRPTVHCRPAVAQRLDRSRGCRLPDRSTGDEQT